MKNTEHGLSIVLDSQNNTDTLSENLGRLLIGALMTLGIWGMGREMLPVPVLSAALVVLLPAMLLDWRQKWHNYILAAAGVIVLLFVLLCRSEIASSLGAMGNVITQTLTAQTGYYFHGFESQGHTFAGTVAVGLVLVAIITGVVRVHSPVPMLLCSVVVFFACFTGILQADLWLAIYLLGTLLILAQFASGSGKAVFWTAGMVTVLGGCVLLVCSFMDIYPQTSAQLKDSIHAWRYEDGSNPLPEGEISDAGRFNPSSDTALEITMEQWERLYLRGFVGSRYTGSGWEEEKGDVLAKNASLLYTLQKNYFHPFMQLSAANDALENAQLNPISVKVVGACEAYSYLPYGITGVELDYRDLTEPEISAFSGNLYAVDEAYLVQKELSDGVGASAYLDAEAAYRAWVYAQYLDIPEDVSALIAKHMGSTEQILTTTQAKEHILGWLDETLVYDEYTSTGAGSTDLAKYLLETSSYGYSIHYATLGTLAMRSLGIPARYVEGYMVPRSLAGSMGAGETLVLSQEYAHAWVEYYLDGVGWIPFEVTPGFENELVYHLPPDGSGSKDQEPIQETQPPEPDEPPVKQEPDSGSQTRLHMTKVVQNIFLILLLLAIIAFVIRVILLRKRLKQRVDHFREESHREVLLDCMLYQYETLQTMGLKKRNVPIVQWEQDISQLLDGADVMPMLLLAQELSFSNHPISEEQRLQVLSSLEKIMEVWKQKMPLHKQIQWKWIRCKVL